MWELYLRYLSWPVTAVITVTLLAIVFRAPFSEVVRRGGLKISKDGLSIDQAAATAIASRQSSAIATGPALELDAEAQSQIFQVQQVGLSSVIRDQQIRIRANLNELRILQNKDEAINVLIRYLAVFQLYHAAERTYRLIFGSQIAALKRLNLFGPGKTDDLRVFYDAAKEKYPNILVTYSFESFVSFLINFGLMTKTGEEHYVITQLGREFLQWMVMEGVSDVKPL